MGPTPSTTSPLTALERSLKDSLLVSEFRDVHLYAFSRRTSLPNGTLRISHPLPVVAISSILKKTESFCTLLSAPEAVRECACSSEYDYESDSDLDEFEEPHVEGLDASPAVSAPPAPPGPASAGGSSSEGNIKDRAEDPENNQAATKGFTVTATKKGVDVPVWNVAYRTLRACVFYLYTGKINFLPLMSSGTAGRQALLTASNDLAPPCSSKSIYRFAELYGLIELRELAFDEIISQLSPKNILEESFSSFFVRYDRLREHAISYLSRNYSTPDVQQSLPDIIQRIASGEIPHAGGVLRSLLGLPVVISPPTYGRVPHSRTTKLAHPRVNKPMPPRLSANIRQSISEREELSQPGIVHDASQARIVSEPLPPSESTPATASGLIPPSPSTSPRAATRDWINEEAPSDKVSKAKKRKNKNKKGYGLANSTISASQMTDPLAQIAPGILLDSVGSSLSNGAGADRWPPGYGPDSGQGEADDGESSGFGYFRPLFPGRRTSGLLGNGSLHL
ncbi:hypothetical protein V8D89_003590 [Ganoderma adspersum]